MKLVYYTGMFIGAFLVFRFEGLREFIGAAFLGVSIVAETARALTAKEGRT